MSHRSEAEAGAAGDAMAPLADVAHELRTPLAAIRALAEQLRDADADMTPADRQRFQALVVAECERLGRLVDGLLAGARGDAAAAASGQVDAVALLERACALTAPLFAARGATVVLQLPAAPPPPVRGDADALLQVLLNLLGNTLRFVPAGSGRVELALRVDGPRLRVAVADNGPGVDAAARATLFERHAGGGRGLAISRAIVERHGGRLWLDATPAAGGACFCFELPATDL